MHIGGGIRQATPGDAADIYALIRQVFGEAYLAFSIYQAPQSVCYIRRLISSTDQGSLHRFFVLRDDNQLIGFYQAVHNESELFLNYLAVAASLQSRGWGRTLLEHYTNSAASLGCRRLALDVFDTNLRARRWYLNQGYTLRSESFLMQLALRPAAGKSRGGLAFDPDAWEEATAEEQAQGFSKIDCRCEEGNLTVGLIAGRVCKLLSFSGMSLDEAVAAVSNRFCGQRESLVVPSPSATVGEWQVLRAEKVLRFSKEIGR